MTKLKYAKLFSLSSDLIEKNACSLVLPITTATEEQFQEWKVYLNQLNFCDVTNVMTFEVWYNEAKVLKG